MKTTYSVKFFERMLKECDEDSEKVKLLQEYRKGVFEVTE